MNIDKYSRAAMLKVREDYQAGKPIADIQAEHQMGNGTLYYVLDGGPPVEGGGRMFAPIPRRHLNRQHAPGGLRASLVRKLWRTAERQVDEIDQRLMLAERAAGERERDARTLAVLVKTLRELSAIDERAGPSAPAGGEAHDDFADMDEFRRALARRMESIIAERTNTGAGGNDGA